MSQLIQDLMTLASLYGKDPVLVLSRSQVEMRSDW